MNKKIKDLEEKKFIDEIIDSLLSSIAIRKRVFSSGFEAYQLILPVSHKDKDKFSIYLIPVEGDDNKIKITDLDDNIWRKSTCLEEYQTDWFCEEVGIYAKENKVDVGDDGEEIFVICDKKDLLENLINFVTCIKMIMR